MNSERDWLKVEHTTRLNHSAIVSELLKTERV